MRLSIFSVLAIGAGMVSAIPQPANSLASPVKRANSTLESHAQTVSSQVKGQKAQTLSQGSECIGGPICCSSLTTPLDHIVDPILKDLGIDAAEIVGSVGLLCDPYVADTCDSEPQCCTELNLLGGTLALGCSASK
ncbi:Hydrophobin [Penicillium alfredii]|uniref:Hydrophobin n=1 Tax=Penicillium alfredii TaxID=1506179 RepID=A0A9W9G933_9EURO|nr:Hydrophobin [Penicillium alfredii]KAJ5114371.1 Hydrophobin [Penicillium alfredii]